MKKELNIINALCVALGSLFLVGCSAGGDNPGVEYAPQMYHSVPYEPLSQITEESLPNGPLSSWYYTQFINSIPYNDYDGTKPMNQKKPVAGTIPRQFYTVSNEEGRAVELMKYELHKDSVDQAARVLNNPYEATPQLLEQGKQLYLSYCAACHGNKGEGDGKVGEQYKGVPNYTAGRYATLNGGHIYHVITHGKGRMWAHKSLVSPEERWKIVHYVHLLQKGES